MNKRSKRTTLRRGDICTYHHATYQHIVTNYDNYISMPALPFTLK